VVTFLPHPVHMIDAVIVTGTGGRCCIMRLADAACALTRGQHVSVWNDVMAAIFKVWRQIERTSTSPRTQSDVEIRSMNRLRLTTLTSI